MIPQLYKGHPTRRGIAMVWWFVVSATTRCTTSPATRSWLPSAWTRQGPVRNIYIYGKLRTIRINMTLLIIIMILGYSTCTYIYIYVYIHTWVLHFVALFFFPCCTQLPILPKSPQRHQCIYIYTHSHYQSINQSISQSVCLSVYLSICLSVYLSTVSIYLSVYLSIYLLSICLPTTEIQILQGQWFDRA